MPPLSPGRVNTLKIKFHILGGLKSAKFLKLWVKQPPPTPLTEKNLQILFDILIANKISRILTKGIVKISINICLQVKNGGRGGIRPLPEQG